VRSGEVAKLTPLNNFSRVCSTLPSSQSLSSSSRSTDSTPARLGSCTSLRPSDQQSVLSPMGTAIDSTSRTSRNEAPKPGCSRLLSEEFVCPSERSSTRSLPTPNAIGSVVASELPFFVRSFAHARRLLSLTLYRPYRRRDVQLLSLDFLLPRRLIFTL